MPVFHLDAGKKDEDLPEFSIEIPCSQCGRNDSLTEGFGLAGGGYGSYTFCEVCEIVVSKTEEDSDS